MMVIIIINIIVIIISSSSKFSDPYFLHEDVTRASTDGQRQSLSSWTTQTEPVQTSRAGPSPDLGCAHRSRPMRPLCARASAQSLSLKIGFRLKVKVRLPLGADGGERRDWQRAWGERERERGTRFT